MKSFSIRKICYHLMNWTRYNKHDEAWSSANSLFKWSFRNRRRPCCLSSLTVSSDVSLQGDILLPELVTADVSQSFLLTIYKVDTDIFDHLQEGLTGAGFNDVRFWRVDCTFRDSTFTLLCYCAQLYVSYLHGNWIHSLLTELTRKKLKLFARRKVF